MVEEVVSALGELNCAPIKEEEVHEAVREMRKGKAAGLDGCAVQSLRNEWWEEHHAVVVKVTDCVLLMAVCQKTWQILL